MILSLSHLTEIFFLFTHHIKMRIARKASFGSAKPKAFWQRCLLNVSHFQFGGWLPAKEWTLRAAGRKEVQIGF